MHVIGYDRTVYEKERAVIEHQIIEPIGVQIIASDMSKQAIDIAKINAAAAGVEDLITFQVCDFESTKMPDNMEGAVLLFNPEYGERLGEEIELEATYARMGDFLKNKCKGATGYIFTGNLELAKKIRLKPSRRIEFLNAKIDCRLLEYEMYAGTRRVEKDATPLTP
jgi:putative N6-adenine-specific DNA methylase